MIICKELNYSTPVINAMVAKALLHDAEEAITGDLPALVKRRTDWGPVVNAASAELFATANNESDDTVEYVYTQWSGAHNGGVAQAVVKSADLLSALVYCKEERMLGNMYFDTIIKELVHGSTEVCKKFPELQTVVNGLVATLGFSKLDGQPWQDTISHL